MATKHLFRHEGRKFQPGRPVSKSLQIAKVRHMPKIIAVEGAEEPTGMSPAFDPCNCGHDVAAGARRLRHVGRVAQRRAART
jgi:hypothetical protein